MRRFTLAAALVLSVGCVSNCSLRADEEVPKSMTLDDCIGLGMEKQPALAAARASLSATMTGQQALSNMRFAGLFSRDVPVRRQQACLGITIASAQLKQAEWETRYAVTRNYYSVGYAKMQLELVDNLLKKLTEARDHAAKVVKVGVDPTIKITRLDVDLLTINIKLVEIKRAEAFVGIKKATAALREAIGVGLDYPLEIGDVVLPALVKEIDKKEMIDLALANRAEVVMAETASDVIQLEIVAQRRLLFKPIASTFASGADIHSQPIPQSLYNGDYRPGAIGPEMPVQVVGKRADRMARVGDFYDRSLAVVDKTHNLVALEVEATYLKWLQAAENIKSLAGTDKESKGAVELADNFQRDVNKRFMDGGKASGEDFLKARGLFDQVRASFNEALYNHALALAGLERTTAGGYRIPGGKD